MPPIYTSYPTLDRLALAESKTTITRRLDSRTLYQVYDRLRAAPTGTISLDSTAGDDSQGRIIVTCPLSIKIYVENRVDEIISAVRAKQSENPATEPSSD